MYSLSGFSTKFDSVRVESKASLCIAEKKSFLTNWQASSISWEKEKEKVQKNASGVFLFMPKNTLLQRKKDLLGIEAWERHGFIFSIMPVFLTQSKVLFPGMEGDR